MKQSRDLASKTDEADCFQGLFHQTASKLLSKTSETHAVHSTDPFADVVDVMNEVFN